MLGDEQDSHAQLDKLEDFRVFQRPYGGVKGLSPQKEDLKVSKTYAYEMYSL